MVLARKLGGACLAVVLSLVSTAAMADLPPGFERTILADGLCQPTSVLSTSDGRIFFALLDGEIRVIENDVVLSQPLLQIDVMVANEQGLVEMVLDPEFDTNGFLYIYYTWPGPTEAFNRVSRFTVVGNEADPASEFVLWQNTESLTVQHQGGGLAFHSDGTLFVATGDQGSAASAQIPSNAHGKLLRFNPDGTIPNDNPFNGTVGVDPAIWALGFRNPYRLFFDAVDEQLWIGDIGSSGANAWEEINLAQVGANYGWANQEGAECFVADCTAFVPPVHAYRHDDPVYSTPTLNACVILGPRYRGGSFPAEYDGDIFYGDWSGEWIRRLQLDASGAVIGDELFDSRPDSGSVVDLALDPVGDLLVATVGVPWCFPPDMGTIYRIAWVGLAPVVAVSADVTSGASPLEVAFTSAGTVDGDDGPQPLTYLWDFADGNTSTDPNPTHVFDVEGRYPVTLTVSDGQYSVESISIVVVVGDPPLLRRGDCNDDGNFNIADAVFALDVLFSTGSSPSCDDACDANDDGMVNIADAVTMLDTLFGGPGGSLVPPFPDCGSDPGVDLLGCASSTCP